MADQRDERGHRLVVRNGCHQPRNVTTAAGVVEVKAPRVNDKRVDEATCVLGNSIYKRFSRWAADGTWEKLLGEAHKRAESAGDLDWVVSIDSTIARVHQHGAILARHTGGSTELQESARRGELHESGRAA